MLERVEKLQIVSLGILVGLALIVSTKMVASTIQKNEISVTGSAYEIVKSDKGTLSFDIEVKKPTRQEAYKSAQDNLKVVQKYLKDKKIELNDYMEGPNAYLFADSIIEPIKVVSKFAKAHPALEVRVGYIDNEIADKKVISEYATIPSMEGLLTMFAGGLIEHVRNLSIGLNLYAEKLEKGGNN